jgi:hypothetical protein
MTLQYAMQVCVKYFDNFSSPQLIAFQPTFKGYWQMVLIFHSAIVLKAAQTSSLGQKRLS